MYESVRLSNEEDFFYVPEYKIEFKIDARKNIKIMTSILCMSLNF